MGICILVFIVLFIFAVLQRGARLPSWCRRKSGRQIFFVLLGVNSLACYLFYVDNHVKWMDEGGKVERNTYGAGIKSETLLAEVEGREIPVTVELEERQYKDGEIQDVFQKTMDELDTVILGNNKSFDEVREDLRLPSKLPGSPITISWECDNYEVLNILGELQKEAIPEEGALVEMRGTLKYLDEEEIYIRSVRVLPPDLQGDEKIAEELKNEIKKMSDRHPDESEVALPSEWEGQQIRWKRPGEQRGYSVLVLGMTVGLLMALMEREKQKEEEKKRRRQMVIDYPEILNKMVLFLSAGMTVRGAWQKIVSDYRQERKKENVRYAYEEMEYTLREMQTGMAENESYERFGKRCQAVCYLRFGALLSQNLRRGSKGLADLLRLEAVNAFEERKRTAKRTGEETGSKLLLPMFLMLAVVLVIVIVPAFLSMQM